jgi:hypothetical protein
MNIASILRHWATLLGTLLTGWLVLPADAQAELQKALGDIAGPLAIAITLIITAAWRLALAWLGKVFRNGSGELDDGGPKAGSALLLMISTAAALGTALPSCSVEYPLTGSVMLQDPDSGAKGGLVYERGRAVSARAKIPVFDQNNRQVGYVDLRSGK